MPKIIKPYFAGTWYPATKTEIVNTIKNYENEITLVNDDSLHYIAGVVPHAGWVYSGKIACNVFYNLSNNDSDKNLVILLGGHLGSYSNSTISDNGFYETPLGNIKISDEASSFIQSRISNIKIEKEVVPDNTIELQLPFIKHYFKNAEILVIKPAPNQIVYEIGKAISDLSDNFNLLLIGSTDLTHYGSQFGFTPHGKGKNALDWVKKVNDKEIVDLTINVSYDKILSVAKNNSNACCSGSLATLLTAVNNLGIIKGKLLEYTTSYDIFPSVDVPESFVGYQGVIY
jgi:MEMO1 family protein